jgi:redoxin
MNPVTLPQMQVALDPASGGAPASLLIGAQGPSFDGLLGVDGRRYGMADFDEHKILALVFTSNRCPTAKAYTGRLNALQVNYGPRGVQLVMINSNDPHLYPEESYARMVSLSREMGYTFPYLFDEGQHVARAYGPTRTFHVFALDRERRLQYTGRFDDARVAASVTTHDLANALDDMLAGQPVRVAQTKAFGCSLDIL